MNLSTSAIEQSESFCKKPKKTSKIFIALSGKLNLKRKSLFNLIDN